MTLQNFLQIKERDVRLSNITFLILQKKLQIDHFLTNQQRDVRYSAKILESRLFLMSRKFETPYY